MPGPPAGWRRCRCRHRPPTAASRSAWRSRCGRTACACCRRPRRCRRWRRRPHPPLHPHPHPPLRTPKTMRPARRQAASKPGRSMRARRRPPNACSLPPSEAARATGRDSPPLTPAGRSWSARMPTIRSGGSRAANSTAPASPRCRWSTCRRPCPAGRSAGMRRAKRRRRRWPMQRSAACALRASSPWRPRLMLRIEPADAAVRARLAAIEAPVGGVALGRRFADCAAGGEAAAASPPAAR